MRSRLLWAAVALAIAALYLFSLNGVGVLDPDEPRYEAIGRAMAQTGDWITPKLWGTPWFEKPPLVYWFTAIGTRFGLGLDLCGRLPVALFSLVFLASAAWLIRTEFGAAVSFTATVLLATSAGWLAFSQFCLTDIPMSACYALAMLLVLRLLRQPDRGTYLAAGALLGSAALAKGLVPLALALPALWFLRRQWRWWPLAVAACLLVAGPWYAAVYARNGQPFLQDFFIRQHFQRLYAASLQHLQPPYYYIPVLLGALFPWTPLFLLPPVWRQTWDARHRFLLATVVFGFLFFTASRNKLPGYLLPLLPSCFVLLASGLTTLPRRTAWLAPALLITSIPLLSPSLFESLAQGRFAVAPVASLPALGWLCVAAPLLSVVAARRQLLLPLLVLCMVASGFFLKATGYPKLDAIASPRSLWPSVRQLASVTCDWYANRAWIYGLNYYRGAAYHSCDDGGHYLYQFRNLGARRPALIPFRR